VRYLEYNHRHAIEILKDRAEWFEFDEVIRGLTRADVIGEQLSLSAVRGTAPAGGQTAINALFRRRLTTELGWTQEPRLFGAEDDELRRWKMDFLKNGVGVEISFNHAEAIAWNLTRLTIAGESPRVREDARIEVGIIVCVDETLKRWARMDSAVGTFDVFKAWLREMRPILPIPLLLIGMTADGWDPTDVFRGTRGRRVT
jgi:hypothetical protein